MSNPSSARRALGPGTGPCPRPQQRPQSHQQPPWSRPASRTHPPRPDAPQTTRRPAPQPALRPAGQAADAIAALRHIRAPAAVLENALYHAQALIEQPHAGPLLLEAAEGLAAVRTCIPA
ncbi:hypothetical protein [Kitasatospora sp. NPDC058190]|uniref:hypothetical protein n=1 Tax=Kitasatospora sp. NPDC058190 TaxID=3346371 RepID=UPI0036DC0A85